jgi:hypothetical protein
VIAEAIKLVLELGKDVEPVVKVGERDYQRDRNGSLSALMEPEQPTVGLSTLSSLCDYLVASPEAVAPEDVIVHVAGPATVNVLHKVAGPWNRRLLLAKATPLAKSSGSLFNSYTGVEEFIIWLMTCFEDSGDRAEVVRLAGNLKAEMVRTVEDDGFTQVAAVKAGARMESTTIKNPVKLHPFRTFPDLEQPAGNFILRLKDRSAEGAPPALALFAVADMVWEKNCVESIRAYLAGKLESFTVLV